MSICFLYRIHPGKYGYLYSGDGVRVTWKGQSLFLLTFCPLLSPSSNTPVCLTMREREALGMVDSFVLSQESEVGCLRPDPAPRFQDRDHVKNVSATSKRGDDSSSHTSWNPCVNEFLFSLSGKVQWWLRRDMSVRSHWCQNPSKMLEVSIFPRTETHWAVPSSKVP